MQPTFVPVRAQSASAHPKNILHILLLITPEEARSNLTPGASGKLGEKQNLMFVKVKNHQTAQALHFYKLVVQATLSTTFKPPNGIPKLQFSWVAQSKLTSMNSTKDAILPQEERSSPNPSRHRPATLQKHQP